MTAARLCPPCTALLAAGVQETAGLYRAVCRGGSAGQQQHAHRALRYLASASRKSPPPEAFLCCSVRSGLDCRFCPLRDMPSDCIAFEIQLQPARQPASMPSHLASFKGNQ